MGLKKRRLKTGQDFCLNSKNHRELSQQTVGKYKEDISKTTFQKPPSGPSNGRNLVELNKALKETNEFLKRENDKLTEEIHYIRNQTQSLLQYKRIHKESILAQQRATEQIRKENALNNHLTLEKQLLEETQQQLESKINILEQRLQQYEDTNQIEEKLNNLIDIVDSLYEKWRTRHQENRRLMDQFAQVVRDLGFESTLSLQGSEEAERIDDHIENLRKKLSETNVHGFVLDNTGLQLEYQKIQEAMDHLSIPWNSVLIDMLERLLKGVLSDKISPLDEIPLSLQNLLKSLGFELIWPARGEPFSFLQHRILDERKDTNVARGRIVRTITPGLCRNDEVLVKASIYLAK